MENVQKRNIHFNPFEKPWEIKYISPLRELRGHVANELNFYFYPDKYLCILNGRRWR
jgi:hypothetical protein